MKHLEQIPTIRSLKLKLKDQFRRNDHKAYRTQWTLFELKNEFRHRHIAHSMHLGTDYKDIEQNVKIGNEPNWTIINDYIEKLK